MPIYIMLSTLTDEGRKTIRENPERIKAVNKEVEAMGVTILAQYATLGLYDFVNILDSPTSDEVAKVSMELGGRGTLQTMTMSGMTLEDFIIKMKKQLYFKDHNLALLRFTYISGEKKTFSLSSAC